MEILWCWWCQDHEMSSKESWSSQMLQPKKEDTCSRQHWLYRLIPEAVKLRWFHLRPQMLDMELEGAVGIIGLGTFKVMLGAFCVMRWPWACGNRWNDWFEYSMSPTGSCVQTLALQLVKLFLEVSERGDGTLTEEMDYKRAVINDCISFPFWVHLVSWYTWVVIVTHFHSYELCHDRLYLLYPQTKLNPSLENVWQTFDNDSNQECTQKSKRGQIAIEAKSVQENVKCVMIGMIFCKKSRNKMIRW